jgi:uncharacterized protein YjiS (DUF1127 family)
MTSLVVAFPTHARRSARPAPRLRIAAAFARLRSGLGEAVRLRRERRYLDEMDDRALRDIGITRADVEAELRHAPSWSALLFRG